MLIVALQHWNPDKFLNVFEWRIFLYSSVLTVTLFIYALFYISKDWYEFLIDQNYEDEEEAAFSALSVFAIVVLVSAGGVMGYSGMQLNEMGQFSSEKASQASTSGQREVYRMYCILALVLFVAMFVFCICMACADYASAIMLCWMCVLMIFIDITG